MPHRLLFFLAAVVLTAFTPADILQQADDLFQADKYLETVSLLDDKLDDFRRENDPNTLSEALSLLASSYYRLGKFDDALRMQEECYEVDRRLGDPKAISSSLNNLAAINFAAGYLDKAEEMIREAIRVEESLGESEALAVRYGTACDILLRQNRPEEAAGFVDKAYALDKAAGRTYKTGIRASQRAEVFMAQKKWTEAWECLQEAAEIFEKEHHLHSLSVCRRQQGTLARQMGNGKMAANYLREALRLVRTTGNQFLEKLVCLELAEVLKPTDPEQACRFLETGLALTDTLYKQETARMTADFNARYDLAGKEHEIESQRDRLRVRLLVIILLLTVVLLLGAVTIMLARLSAAKEKNNRILRKASDLKDRLLALGVATDSGTEQAREVSSIIHELSAIGEVPENTLTQREREIAELTRDGLLSKEIADRLHISQRTVETHKKNIFRKLGINSSVELARLMNQRDKNE